MEDMVKVVDTFTGITIAYLDWDAFERSEATMAIVALKVGQLYGCEEVELSYPNGNLEAVCIK